MCGRYTLTDLDDWLMKRFELQNTLSNFSPKHNVFPSQLMPVVVRDERGNRAELMEWGFVPSWNKEPHSGIINARAETVSTLPSFKKPFRSQRCLVPASGFYEWAKTPEGKVPYLIKLKGHDQKLFGLAGIYDTWVGANGLPITTFAIITCQPNELVRPIHDRMPVILKADDEKRWLDPALHDGVALRELLKPYPAEWMEAYPVSRAVNDPANNSPELIKPVRTLPNR